MNKSANGFAIDPIHAVTGPATDHDDLVDLGSSDAGAVRARAARAVEGRGARAPESAAPVRFAPAVLPRSVRKGFRLPSSMRACSCSASPTSTSDQAGAQARSVDARGAGVSVGWTP